MKTTLLESLDYFKNRIARHDIFTHGAALALYTVFALPPLVILLLKFLSSLQLSLQKPMINEVQQLMGADAAKVLETIIENSKQYSESQVTLWGFIVLGISASVIFAQLQSSLNIIFESENVAEIQTTFKSYIKQFISRRIICFGMVLTFIFISIVSLIISGFLSVFATDDLKTWFKILQTVGNLIVYAVLFSIILHWMPDRKVPWKAAVQGGLLISFLFMVGKVLIGIYLVYETVGSAYGAMGSLGVLLIWVFYSSLIFLLGAEISATLSRERKHTVNTL